MIKERYVNLEVAKLLRNKGFDIPVNYEYHYKIMIPQFHRKKHNFNGIEYHNCSSEWYSAPTQQMACDWIEEQYGIFIQINRYNQYYEGREVIFVTKEDKERGHMTMYYARVFDKHSVSNTTKHYDTIESAYNEALKYALTNLI